MDWKNKKKSSFLEPTFMALTNGCTIWITTNKVKIGTYVRFIRNG